MNPAAEQPVTGSMRVWLRLEGFSVLMLALFVYGQRHGSWPLFAILFFAPDLSMLGYLLGSRVGALAYNVVHSYILPFTLAGFACLKDHQTMLACALIWVAHIGFDRTLGYGLKYGSNFGHTHLGWLGKQRLEEHTGLR